jgi:hypothetical protein
MPKAEIPAATATFNVVFRVGSSFGTAVLAVVVQQAMASRIPGVRSLADASRLHGTRPLAELTGAFGTGFWWVAALAVGAIVPALFIPGRGEVSMTSLLSQGSAAAPEGEAGQPAAQDAPVMVPE